MRLFQHLLAFSLLVYLGISTISPDAPIAGVIGAVIGTYNKVYFGYFSFFYPFALMFLTIYLYKNDHLVQLDHIKLILPTILLLLAILVFQALVVDGNYYGALGGFIVNFLTDYIGEAGIWIFILSTLVLGLILMQEILNFTFPMSFSFFGFFESLKSRTDKILYKDNSSEFLTTSTESIQEKKSQPLKHKNLNTYEEINNTNIDDVELVLPGSINELFNKQPSKSEKTEPTYSKIEAIKKESNSFVEKKTPAVTPKKIPAKNIEKPKNVPIVKELEENAKLLKEIKQGKMKKPKNFKLPYLNFLKAPPKRRAQIDDHEIDKKVQDLKAKLLQFKIEGDVVRTYTGPVVTTFEFKPAPHIKVSKILTLQDDLAMALKATTIRIQAPIPGKDVVGIEIPNKESQTIYLKEVLDSEIFQKSSSELTIALGKDIVGNPFVTDLKKLPHLLIAGTTGSGKSVGVNSMLISLLYRNSPDQLKLLMIDPKMLEFSIYNDIPHLLTPVITQAKQAILALSNMVIEMERRYKMMSKTKTKNIENYNEKAKKEDFDEFPYIVIIIDELADLMMTSGKDVEFYIARLAQMARASGIHIIVATQRPSVDVVTGLIKANLPSRISYKVGQRIDSKIILDTMGAESLLGRGDMLFTPPGTSTLIRLHAPFVTESEIETIVEFLKVQREVVYDPSFLSEPSSATKSESALSLTDSGSNGDFDELYEDAKAVILTDKKTSISYLQRRLQIGYNRSARIIEQLEMMGVISAPNVKGQREILE